MWYSSVNEPVQTVPSKDAKVEPQSDSLLEHTEPVAHSERTDPLTTPGSEYWLP